MAFAFYQMAFAVFLLFLAINSTLAIPKEMMVPKTLEKQDYIYLYQFNRTSFAPTQNVHDQFIEGLLILMKVKFHRIAKQFFMGSQPFIQFNGKYYDGVKNILELLNEKYEKEIKKLKTKKDEEVQKFALDISFKILMKDRSRRIKNETENEASTSTKTYYPPIQKSKIEQMTMGKQKTNVNPGYVQKPLIIKEPNPPHIPKPILINQEMAKDKQKVNSEIASSIPKPISNQKMAHEEQQKAKTNSEMEGHQGNRKQILTPEQIREQIFQKIPGLLGKFDVHINSKFQLGVLDSEFVTDYFVAANDGGKKDDKEKYNEFKENVVGLTRSNWSEFQQAMEKYITNAINNAIKEYEKFKKKKNVNVTGLTETNWNEFQVALEAYTNIIKNAADSNTKTNSPSTGASMSRKKRSPPQKMSINEPKANPEMAGLDFMVYDQGIREQLFPAIPDQLGKKDVLIGQFKVKELTRKFLMTYFDAINGDGRRDAEEIKENVVGLTETNWDEFQKAMEAYITNVLSVVLISNNGNASEEKLKDFLQQNKYDGRIYYEIENKFEAGQIYNEIHEAKVYKIFMKKMYELIITQHELANNGKKLFLGGNKPCIGDVALFSILEQFFETPLNIPEFKQLFQPTRLNADDNEKLKGSRNIYKVDVERDVRYIQSTLVAFYTRMKKQLGFEKDIHWTVLTQKPWPLNYEDIWRKYYGKKFDGPYVIETDELNHLPILGETNSMEGTTSKNGNDVKLVKEIVAKINAKAMELSGGEPIISKSRFGIKGKPIINDKLQEMMLAETAAYLCNLGPGKDGGEKCRKKHAKKSEGLPENIKEKTRKVVYGTIVDYYDRLVYDNVIKEINRWSENDQK